MTKSVRASLTIYQHPWFARDSSGILVVAIAVVMMINKGIDAARVHTPNRTGPPQTISKPPTEWAMKYGCAKPMRVNRTTPIFESMNFRIPWVKKISPTGKRISKRLAGPFVG